MTSTIQNKPRRRGYTCPKIQSTQEFATEVLSIIGLPRVISEHIIKPYADETLSTKIEAVNKRIRSICIEDDNIERTLFYEWFAENANKQEWKNDITGKIKAEIPIWYSYASYHNNASLFTPQEQDFINIIKDEYKEYVERMYEEQRLDAQVQTIFDKIRGNI